MGRLGFNLVRQKEAAKANNLEAGIPTSVDAGDQQQNTSNENVEIGELILAVEERNRKIKNLHLLSSLLTIVIIILSGYILLDHVRVFRADQSDAVEAEKMVMDYKNHVDALKDSYEAVLQEQLAQLSSKNSALESARANLEAELGAERSRLTVMSQHYNEELENKQEAMTKVCQEAQDELKSELRKLGDERADLERRLAEASRQLERHASSLTRQPKSSPAPTTTTTTTTTTTPAPRTTPARGVFDTDRFRKFNDLLKDIESGAAIFDLRGFMKKTDEILSF